MVLRTSKCQTQEPARCLNHTRWVICAQSIWASARTHTRKRKNSVARGDRSVRRRGRAADPEAGGVSIASSDDALTAAGLVSVSRDGLIGIEVQVALDRKPEFAAHGGEFSEAHVAEFGAS